MNGLISRLRARVAGEAPRTSRRAAAGSARNAGFSYVEIITGITVFSLMSAGVAAGLVQATNSIGRTKQDSAAHKIAAAELDTIRTLGYDDVGTTGGNPPGTLTAQKTTVVGGITYSVAIDVHYVDDAAQGQNQTYVNYKKATVVVTPQTATSAAVTQTTLVAPPAYGSVANKATAIVQVVDAFTNAPIPGVSVTIDQSTSPPFTDTTETNGQVLFAGLLPSATGTTDPKYKYRLTATKAGWATHSTTTPAIMQQHLAASQTWNATIKMYRPATINVNLRNAGTGALVTQMGGVTVGGSTGQQGTLYGATGAFTFTTLGGQDIARDQYAVLVQADCYLPRFFTPQTMPAGYPDVAVHTLDADLTPVASPATITVTVKNTLNQNLQGATVELRAGPNVYQPVLRSTDSLGRASFCVPPGTNAYPYTVAAYGAGMEAVVTTLGAGATTATVQLPANASTCSVRLNAGAGDKVVRVQDQITGYSYDDHEPTTSLAGPNSGTAFFTNLRPGSYKAYVEASRGGGGYTWNPGSGKNFTCSASNPNQVVTVP